jgi:menaquinone-dependent protoporphyrinogen oxidase
MPTSILVTYATRYGSTLEVAECITETLRKEGLEVDLQPARNVKSLKGYQAVILGAPLYMFRWHADARSFLGRNQAALKSMPVAIFGLGPFHNLEEELASARGTLDKELVSYAWLNPVATQMFVGKFDPNALRFPYSLIGPLKKMPASDERDWDAIRAWAGSLVSQLKVNQEPV